MTFSRLFLYFCLGFIVGIFSGSIIPIPQPYLLGFLLFSVLVVLVSLLKKKKTIGIIILCFVIFMLGSWCYQKSDFNIKNNDLTDYNGKEVLISGKILTEPDVRLNTVQLTIDVQKIAIGENIFPVTGKVLVKTDKYPEYDYADVLIIRGSLKESAALLGEPRPVGREEFEDFNYKDYLSRQGVFSLMDWPKIEVIKKKNYSDFWQFGYAQILKFKNKIRENINQYFSFPQNTLLSAMLLGDQSAMPQDLKDKLNITGLRHITAISGMNVAILCSILMSLLLGLGFWRNQAFWISLIFIFLFVVMVGFQASIVRAGIMGGLFLLGQKVGRLSTGSRSTVIAAAVMLAINPMLLRWDVGFQLSFLAMLGMIFLTKPLEMLFKFIPQEKLINLRSILATTFAAQIFTLPILIYNFGRVSLVSPLTNVLILPVIYWIMIFGFLFGLSSAIFSGLGWIFVLPCWFLIAYSMKVIDIFSQPWFALVFQNVYWLWPVIFYLLLAVITIWLNKKIRSAGFEPESI